MGLPAFGERKSPLRIDLVSLEGTSDDIRLVFWEAKMIGDSRLRSKEYKPKVLKQMDDYRSYLAEPARKQQVVDAYRNCCRIIRDFQEMASGLGLSRPIAPLIVAAAESDRLHVEERPRLIIFDDGDKREKPHGKSTLRYCVIKKSLLSSIETRQACRLSRFRGVADDWRSGSRVAVARDLMALPQRKAPLIRTR